MNDSCPSQCQSFSSHHENAIVATDFVSKLRDQVPTFLKDIEQTLLEQYNLNVSDHEADHICWRTSTVEEYTELVTSLKQSSEVRLLIESMVGGRLIATFQLEYSIPVQRFHNVKFTTEISNDHTQFSYFRYIDTIEIPSPKKASQYKSGLEHVEFVIPTSTFGVLSSNPIDKNVSSFNDGNILFITPQNDIHHQTTFEEFMMIHANVPWNIKAMQKELNPDISIQLKNKDCSVKFHLIPLAQVIEYEKSLKHE
jgi:predicted metalloenzyme YecM